MYRHWARATRHQAQCPSQTGDVRVGRQDLPAERVHQDAPRRLDADAWQCGQVGLGLGVTPGSQLVEAHTAEVGADLFQRRQQSRCLLAGEATVPDQRTYPFDAEGCYAFPSARHRAQPLEDPLVARPGRHLRQHNEHQLIHGVVVVAVTRRPIHVVQPLAGTGGDHLWRQQAHPWGLVHRSIESAIDARRWCSPLIHSRASFNPCTSRILVGFRTVPGDLRIRPTSVSLSQ